MQSWDGAADAVQLLLKKWQWRWWWWNTEIVVLRVHCTAAATNKNQEGNNFTGKEWSARRVTTTTTTDREWQLRQCPMRVSQCQCESAAVTVRLTGWLTLTHSHPGPKSITTTALISWWPPNWTKSAKAKERKEKYRTWQETVRLLLLLISNEQITPSIRQFLLSLTTSFARVQYWVVKKTASAKRKEVTSW